MTALRRTERRIDYCPICRSALRKPGTLLQVGGPTAFLMICVVGVLTGLYMRHSLTELTRARQQREESPMRLGLAMDAAHLGSWQ